MSHLVGNPENWFSLIAAHVLLYLQDPPMIRSLNTSLAFFLQDLLSYMDRGFVFQLIKHYTYEVRYYPVMNNSSVINLPLDLVESN